MRLGFSRVSYMRGELTRRIGLARQKLGEDFAT